ncbi:uncharacterized protein ARMOST_20297 [Armillaria ostoyae]|uniref:Uncharacterized protein n=1 Tax=Armillaria ostoyae TaxID=47428 RepID=A0A284S6Y8_ARMOS|nr:uncharacterized protein ARMOST_20297 [Armillaria ostoyae]
MLPLLSSIPCCSSQFPIYPSLENPPRLSKRNMKLLSATELRNAFHAARATLMHHLNIITAAMRRSVHRGHTESSSAADSPPPSTPDMFSWEERQRLFSVRSATDLNIEETPEFGEFHSDV